MICNLKSCFYTREKMDFSKNIGRASKFRKYARIKNQGAS